MSVIFVNNFSEDQVTQGSFQTNLRIKFNEKIEQKPLSDIGGKKIMDPAFTILHVDIPQITF